MLMPKHKVVITTSRREIPRVEIDGHDIAPGLRSININIGSDGLPHIEAELAVSAVESVRLDSADTRILLSLPTGAHEALVALGWTPPTQDDSGEVGP